MQVFIRVLDKPKGGKKQKKRQLNNNIGLQFRLLQLDGTCDSFLSMYVAGIDYAPIDEDLEFSGSVDRVCKNVSTKGDDILEDDEEFLLILSTSDPDVTLVPDEAIVLINDGDGMYSK